MLNVDLKQEMDELALRSKRVDVEICEMDLGYQPAYKDTDVLSCKQEINRRGIEACISVLKLDPKADAIGKTTRSLAETKLQEFLNSLKTAE